MLKSFIAALSLLLLCENVIGDLPLRRYDPCRAADVIEGFTWNPRGCSWFFYCGDVDDPIEGKCPDSLHFDRKTGKCTYPEWALPCTLDDDHRGALITTCPEGSPYIQYGDRIPHPIACEKYTFCWNGTFVDHDCPPGLHYSFFDNQCVAPFIAECSKNRNFCSDDKIGKFVENPRSCEGYLMCNNCNNEFNIMNFKCSPGYRFNPEINHCDLEENVDDCGDETAGDHSDLPEMTVKLDCPNSRSLSYFNHPTNCTFYFECEDGRSRLRRCLNPANCFDQNFRQCLPPDALPSDFQLYQLSQDTPDAFDES